MNQVRTFIISLLLLNIITAENGKISGLTFFEYSMDKSNSAFELNRAYFTYQKNLSENISYKFQIDAGREEIPTTIDSTTFEVDGTQKSRLYNYIKNAKLNWKTSIGTFTFGMQGMNMFGIQEKNWGYRFIEKTAMDKYKFSSSADLGIGYANKFGPLTSSVLITNGSGYKKPESNEYKKVSMNVVAGNKKLSKSNGYNAGAVFSYEPTDNDPTIVFGFFGATQLNTFRLSGEYNVMDDGHESISLISFYGNVAIGSTFELLGRLDTSNGEKSYIAGVHVKPEFGLSIAPTIRYTTVEGSESSTIFIVNFQFKI